MKNQRLLDMAIFSQNTYNVRFRLGDPNNNATLIACEYNSANSVGAQASFNATTNTLASRRERIVHEDRTFLKLVPAPHA